MQNAALPIDEALPALRAALAAAPNAVLVAPPGAGKTTRAPLALMDEPWVQGRKIIMLEPRRLAARAAANRMAQSKGERLGETIGLRVRSETKVSARTRIEVVTEGVFTRLILDDPELIGIAAVLFDEQHERSLDSDLALALTLDAQAGLRPDLRILPMSATLDGARVATLLGACQIVESQGRAFPVETRYRSRDPQRRIEDEMTDAILAALRSEEGSLLCFLPGAGEIRRVQERVQERLSDPDVIIAPLFGALDFRAQDLAISPAPAGKRKVVLATSIAETSLTIDGVRVVIDSGLSRRPRFDPTSGLTALETVRVSRASADQRRGRAGRTQPGVCWRLWDEQQTRALSAFDKPEILDADLSGLALDLARWGAQPKSLQWLDSPPAAAYAEALNLLRSLHALDPKGHITPHGAKLSTIPLPPRLSHLVIEGAERGMGLSAARVAALLSDRGVGGEDADARRRLERMGKGAIPKDREALDLADRYARIAGARSNEKPKDEKPGDIGALIALAFPERIGRSREDLARGKPGAFVTRSGRGALIPPENALAREPFLAIAEMQGSAAEARITLAAPISRAMIETLFAEDIETIEDAGFDPQTRSVRSRKATRLGRLILSEGPGARLDPDAAAKALAEGLQGLGFPALPGAENFAAMRARLAFLHAQRPDDWPDVSDEALWAQAADWLMPTLAGKTRVDDLGKTTLAEALLNLLPWDGRGKLDRLAPSHFSTPAGTNHPIDYSAAGGPSLGVRVQEMFGLSAHPCVLDGGVPLTVELLSPAYRPVQTTKDLPGFWRGSYAAVRTDMRGRYPKHPWPEDPLNAAPTTRVKPRGT
jgi:ATP-dependent helicase HrpB